MRTYRLTFIQEFYKLASVDVEAEDHQAAAARASEHKTFRPAIFNADLIEKGVRLTSLTDITDLKNAERRAGRTDKPVPSTTDSAV